MPLKSSLSQSQVEGSLDSKPGATIATTFLPARKKKTHLAQVCIWIPPFYPVSFLLQRTKNCLCVAPVKRTLCLLFAWSCHLSTRPYNYWKKLCPVSQLVTLLNKPVGKYLTLRYILPNLLEFLNFAWGKDGSCPMKKTLHWIPNSHFCLARNSHFITHVFILSFCRGLQDG